MLQSRSHLWLSTGNSSGPHLIPLGFVWDGTKITMMTGEHSVTTKNIRANGAARAAIGEPDDVIIVDGTVSIFNIDDIDLEVVKKFAGMNHDRILTPEVLAERAWLVLTPTRILVWNGFHENINRTVMRGGRWLA